MMIDSHVHIDSTKYTEQGTVTDVLEAALKFGVERFVAPSVHFESFENPKPYGFLSGITS